MVAYRGPKKCLKKSQEDVIQDMKVNSGVKGKCPVVPAVLQCFTLD